MGVLGRKGSDVLRGGGRPTAGGTSRNGDRPGRVGGFESNDDTDMISVCSPLEWLSSLL